MSKSDTYFQFPIAALQHGKPIDQVTDEEMKTCLLSIVDYCIIEVGTAIVERDNDEAVIAQCERYADSHQLKLDKMHKHHRIWLCGADTLGVSVPSCDNRSGKNSWDAIKRLPGGRKQARLRTDILWDAINGEQNWRQLSTLVGVYAGIGAAKMTRLSFDYIGILALGFSSKAEMNSARQSSHVLALHQTRWTVNELAKRGLFVKASPNRRHMWYSNSMDLIRLANALVKKESDSHKPTPAEVTKAIQASTRAAKPARNPADHKSVINQLLKLAKLEEAM